MLNFSDKILLKKYHNSLYICLFIIYSNSKRYMYSACGCDGHHFGYKYTSNSISTRLVVVTDIILVISTLVIVKSTRLVVVTDIALVISTLVIV